MTRPAEVLTAAAELVEGWPEPYAEPLAELLRAEATHAADLDDAEAGWDRYPPGACLLRLAQGVVGAAVAQADSAAGDDRG